MRRGIIYTFPLIAILLSLKFATCGPLLSTEGSNFTDEGLELIDVGLSCDPLEAKGTAVLCFPPVRQNPDANNSRNCSQLSVPGTIASYSCLSAEDDVYMGFLNCASSGVWITSLLHANNSLCNLDASIVNYEVPDVVIATGIPEFTTPVPNQNLMQPDASFLADHQKVALQVHNKFRKNHGVPNVRMTTQLNDLAQHLVDSITSTGDIVDLETNLKLSPIHRTVNVEMNWYFQIPDSPSLSEAVSHAVQSWYSGFAEYDWEHLERNLEISDALAFSRVVWKATQLIGVGVAIAHNITFVACVYTPGRNILSTDPVHEFQINVPHFKVGRV